MSKPLDMLLWCPACHARHIDEGEFRDKPHHTHACQHCGFTWRPAVVPTRGVQFLPGFKNPEPVSPRLDGKERLSGWFSLSYASWLTLPRVLLSQMPPEWQGKLATLLDEMDSAFPEMPDIEFVVKAKRRGKFIRMPAWLNNYRHPDMKKIARARGEQS